MLQNKRLKNEAKLIFKYFQGTRNQSENLLWRTFISEVAVLDKLEKCALLLFWGSPRWKFSMQEVLNNQKFR